MVQCSLQLRLGSGERCPFQHPQELGESGFQSRGREAWSAGLSQATATIATMESWRCAAPRASCKFSESSCRISMCRFTWRSTQKESSVDKPDIVPLSHCTCCGAANDIVSLFCHLLRSPLAPVSSADLDALSSRMTRNLTSVGAEPLVGMTCLGHACCLCLL